MHLPLSIHQWCWKNRNVILLLYFRVHINNKGLGNTLYMQRTTSGTDCATDCKLYRVCTVKCFEIVDQMCRMVSFPHKLPLSLTFLPYSILISLRFQRPAWPRIRAQTWTQDRPLDIFILVSLGIIYSGKRNWDRIQIWHEFQIF